MPTSKPSAADRLGTHKTPIDLFAEAFSEAVAHDKGSPNRDAADIRADRTSFRLGWTEQSYRRLYADHLKAITIIRELEEKIEDLENKIEDFEVRAMEHTD